MSKAFTLIEVLISVAILSILAIVVFAALNPIEQINRGRDTALIQTAENFVSAVHRYEVTTRKLPWHENLSQEVLTSEPGQTIFSTLISIGELKTSFPSSNASNLAQMYLTAETDTRFFRVCFAPQSLAYQQHPHTVFFRDGSFNEACFNNREGCFFCLGDFELGQAIADAAPQEPEDTDNAPPQDEDPCQDFNPERPNLPWTTNYSDLYSEYGCTNYSIIDRGCDSFCPEGQRHLVQRYYTYGDGFIQCQSHESETTVDFCVSDPYARCDLSPGRSSLSNFEWGCTNPRRPMQWIEE